MENRNIFLISLIIIIIAIILGAYYTGTFENTSDKTDSITVYAGAGFSGLCDDLLDVFNEKYPNITVDMRYARSGELFTALETQQKSDVFFPENYKYMNGAITKGYVANGSVKNITTNVPVIIVQNENPKNITGLEDLAREDIKVGLGELEGPSIGRSSQEILNKSKIIINPALTTSTENQLITSLVSGDIDAAIVWKSLTELETNHDKFEVIPIPENQSKVTTVPIAVTQFSQNNESANTFVDFVSNDKDAREIFINWGYEME